MNQKPSQSRLALRRSHAVRRVARSAPCRWSAISAIEVLTLLPDAALFRHQRAVASTLALWVRGTRLRLAPGVLRRGPEQQGSAIDALQLALRDRDRALHVLAPGAIIGKHVENHEVGDRRRRLLAD